MREDDDIRQYMPVLRRLFILVAVIIAIPVMMWTITAFVRTYVGPPKLPTFRPIAAAPATVGPNEAAAAAVPDQGGKGARQPVLEANATASDGGAGGAAVTGSTADNTGATNGNAAPAAGAPPPAAPGSFQTASLPQANAPANAAPAPANGVSQFAPEDRQASTNWPTPPATNWPNPAAQQPVAEPAADAQPIEGAVPLPRKRPHTFAIAEAHGIPLPRPRPDAAGPAPPEEQQSTPVDWLRHIFGQQPAAAPAPAENE
jgi:hypothetical protein